MRHTGRNGDDDLELPALLKLGKYPVPLALGRAAVNGLDPVAALSEFVGDVADHRTEGDEDDGLARGGLLHQFFHYIDAGVGTRDPLHPIDVIGYAAGNLNQLAGFDAFVDGNDLALGHFSNQLVHHLVVGFGLVRGQRRVTVDMHQLGQVDTVLQRKPH